MVGLVTTPKRQFYTDAENDVLRGALARLIDSYGTQTRAGEQLGVAQGTVSAFLSGRHGATPGVARKIAQLSGVSVEVLLGWADGGVASSDFYANRAVAAQMARLAGLPETSIRVVEALRLDVGVVDRPVLWWFDRIRSAEQG